MKAKRDGVGLRYRLTGLANRVLAGLVLLGLLTPFAGPPGSEIVKRCQEAQELERERWTETLIGEPTLQLSIDARFEEDLTLPDSGGNSLEKIERLRSLVDGRTLYACDTGNGPEIWTREYLQSKIDFFTPYLEDPDLYLEKRYGSRSSGFSPYTYDLQAGFLKGAETQVRRCQYMLDNGLAQEGRYERLAPIVLYDRRLARMLEWDDMDRMVGNESMNTGDWKREVNELIASFGLAQGEFEAIADMGDGWESYLSLTLNSDHCLYGYRLYPVEKYAREHGYGSFKVDEPERRLTWWGMEKEARALIDKLELYTKIPMKKTVKDDSVRIQMIDVLNAAAKNRYLWPKNVYFSDQTSSLVLGKYSYRGASVQVNADGSSQCSWNAIRLDRCLQPGESFLPQRRVMQRIREELPAAAEKWDPANLPEDVPVVSRKIQVNRILLTAVDLTSEERSVPAWLVYASGSTTLSAQRSAIADPVVQYAPEEPLLALNALTGEGLAPNAYRICEIIPPSGPKVDLNTVDIPFIRRILADRDR